MHSHEIDSRELFAQAAAGCAYTEEESDEDKGNTSKREVEILGLGVSGVAIKVLFGNTPAP